MKTLPITADLEKIRALVVEWNEQNCRNAQPTADILWI